MDRIQIRIPAKPNTTQEDHVYYATLDTLHPLVRGWISAMLQPAHGDNQEAVQLSKLMKTAVKGILIMYGDKILTVLLGKTHEKPPRGCDIVEWYTTTFATVALSLASRSEIILACEDDVYADTQIIEISAKPIPESINEVSED
jgi:hypothetical protein